MTFRDDNGNTIEFDGEFALTKQAANFFDFNIKGDFSIDFDLENNSINRGILGYYGAQQITSPAFSKNAFSLIRNGNTLSKGYIVIKGDDGKSIKCFFVSGNTNWFQTLATHLKDIVFDNKYTVLMSAVTAQVAATDGIIFPVVDWAYSGQKNGYVYMNTNMVDYLNPRNDQIQEIFPCIYLHTVIEQMANNYGIKILGNLINDGIYKRIIITPSGPELIVPDSIIKNTISKVSISANQNITITGTGVTVPINWNLKLDGLSPQFDTVLFRYKVYITGTYEFLYAIYGDTNMKTTGLYVNGSQKSEGTITLIAPVAFSNVSSDWIILNLTAGDYVEFKFTNIEGGGPYTFNILTTSYFYCRIRKEINAIAVNNGNSTICNAKTSYVIPNSILPDITCLDLIKWLSIYFGAICSYDEYSKTLSLNLISTFKKELAPDWSEFYISHETSYQTGAATNNYIQTPDVEDENINAYNNQTLLRFGGMNYPTSYSILKNRDIYQMPFTGSWDEKSKSIIWDGTGTNNFKIFMPFIKFYDLKDNFADNVVITQVLNNAGRAEFSNPGVTVKYLAGDLIRISGTGIYDGYGIVEAVTATSFILRGVNYNVTKTGNANKVDISSIDGVNRILIVKTNQNISDIGFPSPGLFFQFVYYSNTYSVNAPDTSDNKSSAAFAWYDKEILNLPIDVYKESLAMTQINNKVYNNTIDEVYHRPIQNIYNSPTIKAKMLVPEADFLNMDFTKFIYLRSERLTGYFFVASIVNYMDSTIPVEVNLYKVF